MATQNGDLWASFGVMGGFMQPQGHFQMIVAMIDDDLNPQEALNRRFGLGYIGFRLLLLGNRRVKIGARDYSGIQQLLHAAKIGSRQIALRFQGSQLRAFLTHIQFNQDISLMHVLAGLEQNLVDSSRQIGAYGHAVHRFHGADYAHSRRPGLLMRHDARHCLRRGLKM